MTKMARPFFNRLIINRRGCPGSYAEVKLDEDGRGICPYCRNDYSAKRIWENTGILRAHARPR